MSVTTVMLKITMLKKTELSKMKMLMKKWANVKMLLKTIKEKTNKNMTWWMLLCRHRFILSSWHLAILQTFMFWLVLLLLYYYCSYVLLTWKLMFSTTILLIGKMQRLSYLLIWLPFQLCVFIFIYPSLFHFENPFPKQLTLK